MIAVVLRLLFLDIINRLDHCFCQGRRFHQKEPNMLLLIVFKHIECYKVLNETSFPQMPLINVGLGYVVFENKAYLHCLRESSSPKKCREMQAATLPTPVISWHHSFVPHDVELCEKRSRAPPLERTCILSMTRLEAEHLVEPQCLYLITKSLELLLILD
jgi:hypothetical protein